MSNLAGNTTSSLDSHILLYAGEKSAPDDVLNMSEPTYGNDYIIPVPRSTKLPAVLNIVFQGKHYTRSTKTLELQVSGDDMTGFVQALYSKELSAEEDTWLTTMQRNAVSMATFVAVNDQDSFSPTSLKKTREAHAQFSASPELPATLHSLVKIRGILGDIVYNKGRGVSEYAETDLLKMFDFLTLNLMVGDMVFGRATQLANPHHYEAKFGQLLDFAKHLSPSYPITEKQLLAYVSVAINALEEFNADTPAHSPIVMSKNTPGVLLSGLVIEESKLEPKNIPAAAKAILSKNPTAVTYVENPSDLLVPSFDATQFVTRQSESKSRFVAAGQLERRAPDIEKISKRALAYTAIAGFMRTQLRRNNNLAQDAMEHADNLLDMAEAYIDSPEGETLLGLINTVVYNANDNFETRPNGEHISTEDMYRLFALCIGKHVFTEFVADFDQYIDVPINFPIPRKNSAMFALKHNTDLLMLSAKTLSSDVSAKEKGQACLVASDACLTAISAIRRLDAAYIKEVHETPNPKNVRNIPGITNIMPDPRIKRTSPVPSLLEY